MSTKSVHSTGPIGPITMGLSGGGYRAASFHLGTFSYLDHLDLLKDVQVISTVSGGTIFGATYAVSLKGKDHSFASFFNRFYDILAKANLIDGALDKLGDLNRNTYAGYDDLITAMAQCYNDLIFKGARFGIFWDKKPIHLKEIIFNATEFRTAIAFRFQKSEDPRAIIGNQLNKIDHDVARQIRLADIVAASACFPGGFEPLVFPNDFQWPDGKLPKVLKQNLKHPLPLMDGGVYDNQGIDSMMLAVNRQRKIHKDKNYPGLVIVSDTDQFDDDLFDAQPADHDDHQKGISISTLKKIGYLILGLSFLSLVFLIKEFMIGINKTGFQWDDSFVFVFPIIVIGAVTFTIFWLYRKINRAKALAQGQVPQLHADDWAKFANLSLDQMLELIGMRVTSLLALTSKIFMRQVRRLIYSRLYDDSSYDKKRIANLIYALVKEKPPAKWLTADKTLKAIATRASEMPTTLWFDNEQQLDEIVICGQATVCYKILEWIIDTHGKDKKEYPAGIQKLHKQARDDWERFNKQPDWLLTRIRKS